MWSRREFRFNRFRDRLFDRGDLKYVILELLKEKPRHGYEVIRALEERFGGWYAPSPGAVYPTLQMLEDMGYASATEQDGKKVFAITSAGEQFVSERRPVVDEIFGRMRERWDPAMGREMHHLMQEMREFVRSFAQQARRRWPDAEQMRRIREVITRARADIQAILAEDRTTQRV